MCRKLVAIAQVAQVGSRETVVPKTSVFCTANRHRHHATLENGGTIRARAGDHLCRNVQYAAPQQTSLPLPGPPRAPFLGHAKAIAAHRRPSLMVDSHPARYWTWRRPANPLAVAGIDRSVSASSWR